MLYGYMAVIIDALWLYGCYVWYDIIVIIRAVAASVVYCNGFSSFTVLQ